MLSDDLKILLASQFAYYLKAQYFHWNVEGSDFAQLHDFFQNIYEDAYSAVDPIAEYIRSLEDYAPGSFERYQELSQIPGQTNLFRDKRPPRAAAYDPCLSSDDAHLLQTWGFEFRIRTS